MSYEYITSQINLDSNSGSKSTYVNKTVTCKPQIMQNMFDTLFTCEPQIMQKMFHTRDNSENYSILKLRNCFVLPKF